MIFFWFTEAAHFFLSFFLGFIRKRFQIFIITSRLIAGLNFLVNVHITEKGNSK